MSHFQNLGTTRNERGSMCFSSCLASSLLTMVLQSNLQTTAKHGDRPLDLYREVGLISDIFTTCIKKSIIG